MREPNSFMFIPWLYIRPVVFRPRGRFHYSNVNGKSLSYRFLIFHPHFLYLILTCMVVRIMVDLLWVSRILQWTKIHGSVSKYPLYASRQNSANVTHAIGGEVE